MRLCVGTSKGIVILDPARGGVPIMVLADPASVWCMAQDSADPALIYAGSTAAIRGKGTLARSSDGGRTWTDITPSGARDEEVWAVAAPPAVKDRLFVGTSHARLLRSDDAGRTFRECEGFLKIPGRDRWTFPPPPHIPHVRAIAFDPSRPQTFYAGVEEGGIFRSRDGGATFEGRNSGLYGDIHSIAADPRDPERLFATTGGGFYRSSNGGKSWERVTDGLDRSYVVPLLANSRGAGAIFTAGAAGPPPMWSAGPAGADAALYCSRNGGYSFEPIAMEPERGRGMIMRMRPDPERGGFFAAANDGAVLRLAEDGARAETIAEKLPPAYDLAVIH
ncbi:MAG: WD40/YVTN/BNR-like repeat-containing protein [Candidatus Binataceae bacterium]